MDKNINYHMRDDEKNDNAMQIEVLKFIKPKIETVDPFSLNFKNFLELNKITVSPELNSCDNDTELCQNVSELCNIQPNNKNTKTIIDSTTDINELIYILYDGDENSKIKCEALDIIYSIDKDIALENINKIRNMCMFEFSKMLEDTIIDIVLYSRIPNDLKYQCSISLYEEKPEYSFKCLEFLALHANNLVYPIKINIFKILFSSLDYVHLLSTFESLITDLNYDVETRYKTMIEFSKCEKILSEYIQRIFWHFFLHECSIRYKILTCQYILQNKCSSKDNINQLQIYCVELATNSQLDYSLRADVSDLLIRSGDDSSKKIGLSIIKELGTQNKKTIFYSNSENVHDEKIDESVNDAILQIASHKLLDDFNYENIVCELQELTKKGDYIDAETIEKNNLSCNVDNLTGSLIRISLDSTIYPGNQTLKSIFLKIWQIICNCDKECSKTLKSRLIEELIDMYNTCTSGHVTKLINVFSGNIIEGVFPGKINIGFKNQIAGNLSGRLNKKIKDISNPDIQEKVLDQLTETDFTNRKDFMNFFSENILEIKKEMYEEFVDKSYITSDEFESHFRDAISIYDCADI